MSANELQKPTFSIVKCAGIASKMLEQFCLKDSNVLFYFLQTVLDRGFGGMVSISLSYSDSSNA